MKIPEKNKRKMNIDHTQKYCKLSFFFFFLAYWSWQELA